MRNWWGAAVCTGGCTNCNLARRTQTQWSERVEVGLLRPAYVASVASWKILEGIWAASGKPIPPRGAVWAHIDDLTKVPPALETRLQKPFRGDTGQRIGAAIQLSDWIVPVLDQSEEGTGPCQPH